MTQIDKIGYGQRRHVYVSAELDAVMDELLPDYAEFSRYAESAMWRAMLEDYGEEAVLEAVEAAHAEMSEDERLPENRRKTLELRS